MIEIPDNVPPCKVELIRRAESALCSNEELENLIYCYGHPLLCLMLDRLGAAYVDGSELLAKNYGVDMCVAFTLAHVTECTVIYNGLKKCIDAHDDKENGG